jgi:hypothetical protein
MLGTARWLLTAAMVTGSRAATSSESSDNDAFKAFTADAANATDAFYKYSFIIFGSLVVLGVVWRLVLESVRYVRTLTCLNNPTQRYFLKPSSSFASFKENVLYAPMFRKRHNREFQLSSAVNMGTLPTRSQFLFLLAYLATNVSFCVLSIHWEQSFDVVAKELRNRSGVLAMVNMVPLFILAARNNPLINWMNISCDTFNLLHRWFGRIVVLESLVHTVAWIVTLVIESGWSTVASSLRTDPMILFGLIVSFCVRMSRMHRHTCWEFFSLYVRPLY